MVVVGVAAMNGSAPDELPPLGKKIEPPAPASPAPEWKAIPGQRGYVTDGRAVKRADPEALPVNPWAEWIKAHRKP